MKKGSSIKCFSSVTFKLSITMNTTTLNQTLPPPNYCVLPTQHSHSFPTILLQDLALDEEEEELIFNGKNNLFTDHLKQNHDHQIATNNNQIVSKRVDNENSKISKNVENLEALTSLNSSKQNFSIDNHHDLNGLISLTALESGLDDEIYANYQQQQQQFDPYIDAVQVKSRINNKRGARVKALGSPRDHEPKPSYYSKTVHVETSSKKEDHHHNDDGDWETDDEADEHHHDEHEDDHHHHHHYSPDKKHGKKKVVYKVKTYPAKGYKKKKKKGKKKNNHYYYLHGGKHGASGYGYDKGGLEGGGGYSKHYKGKGKKGYKKKKKLYAPKKKKVTYAYIYKKPKAKHYHSHDHHDHYDDGKYKYHQKHHHHHHHGMDKYKMVHMDHHQLMDHHHKGGKMSIAGLLGYTLLCVNYLLVLKQPTYDKYNSHEYTKYSPHDKHGKHGELVHVKGGGPVILAHCAELKKFSLPKYEHQYSPSNNKIRFIRSTNPKLVDHFMKKLSNTSLEPAESYDYHHSNDDHHNHEDDPSSSGLYYLRRSNNARSSPPAYYYTLSPSYGSNQHSVGSYSGGSNGYSYSDYDTTSSVGGGLLSPIQNYLNRLLMPTSISAGNDHHQQHDYHHDEHHHDDNNYSYAPIRVVGSPRARLIGGNNNRGGGGGGRVIVGGQPNGRFGLLGGLNNNARLIIVDGQPQVVRQRDNLVDLRSRQVDIQMHVIRRNFVGTKQMINIPEDPDFMLARRGNLGVQVPIAVRPPNNQILSSTLNDNTDREQMQADQPIDNTNNSTLTNNNGANNQILDLPEYALSGDSIELTCNHRIPISRLYSVKWFKDSLEFYRFIPANGARSKSSLFLPDVRLDLARSNSQMLYLRNVTHRTSGLYRCEVVSEGPNFETISGEKRMQVYTLPDNGPQLNLLERAQLPVSTPPPLSPLTAVTVITPGQPRRVIQQVSGEREDTTNTPASNFLSDFGTDSDNANLLRQRDSVSIDGPLIRCSSTRSSPVAQLRFFINNRPVELNRTLENATTSYTDGTESNVVSFKILLSDFLMLEDEVDNSVLDRAASKKTNSSKADQQLDTNKPVSLALTSVEAALTSSSTTTTTTTTTTTSTTTPRPSSKAPDKAYYANANVQFDDQNVSMKSGDFKVGAKMKPISADKEQKKKANKKKKKKKQKKKQKADKQSEISGKKLNSYPANYDDEISNFDEYSDATDESLDEKEALNNPLLELQPLPVAEDKANIERKRSESVAGLVDANRDSVQLNDESEREKRAKESEVKAANYDHSTEVSKSGSKNSRNKRETTNTKSEPELSQGSDSEASSKRNKYQSPNGNQNKGSGGNQLNRQPNLSSSNNNNNINKDVESNQEHLRLVKQEQRVRQQTSSNSNRVSELYSNYIRIKCTSLVPAVGYEMTSELNVPLTVLVPARQISDALRQQPGGGVSQQQQNFRLRDSEIATFRRRQQQQELGGANNDETSSKLFSGSRFAIRNGGSLQAPRAVLIDRLAQASSPEPSSPSRSSNYSSSAATTFSSAPPTSRNSKQQQQQQQKAVNNKQANSRNTDSTNSLHKKSDKSVANNSAYSTLNQVSMFAKRLFGKGSAGRRELFNTTEGFFPYQLITPLIISFWLLIFAKTSFGNNNNNFVVLQT